MKGRYFTDNLKTVIATNISQLRKENGYTQLELAEKLSYSDKSISKWERGDAIPDIAVLKEISDLFGVPLDYMVEEEHSKKSVDSIPAPGKLHNRAFITGICILAVWLLAIAGFVITDMIVGSGVKYTWLSFVYAVPVSMIVWLVFNSLWFNKRRNYLIVSLLMWSCFASVFISFVMFGINAAWKVFILGIPAQVIILLCSKLKYKKRH